MPLTPLVILKTVLMKVTTMSNAKPPANNPPKRASGLNTAQRYTVRVVLLTGAMLAALIGAQAMAVIDKSAITATPALPTSAASPASVVVTATPARTAVKPRATATLVPPATRTK